MSFKRLPASESFVLDIGGSPPGSFNVGPVATSSPQYFDIVSGSTTGDDHDHSEEDRKSVSVGKGKGKHKDAAQPTYNLRLRSSFSVQAADITLAPDSDLPPGLRRDEIKWHRRNEKTVWYSDYRGLAFETPGIAPNHADLEDGHLYIQYEGEGGQVLRMWVRKSDGAAPAWVKAYIGYHHPTISGRFLIVNKRLQPSWVVGVTIKKYESDNRKANRSEI